MRPTMMRLADRFRRRRPTRELELDHDGFTGNPLHDTMWPLCRRPLPHPHPLGTLDKNGYSPPERDRADE